MAVAEVRHAPGEDVVCELGNLLTGEDTRSIRQDEAELYDDAGPRSVGQWREIIVFRIEGGHPVRVDGEVVDLILEL
jgi:hypothetical protein